MAHMGHNTDVQMVAEMEPWWHYYWHTRDYDTELYKIVMAHIMAMVASLMAHMVARCRGRMAHRSESSLMQPGQIVLLY